MRIRTRSSARVWPDVGVSLVGGGGKGGKALSRGGGGGEVHIFRNFSQFMATFSIFANLRSFPQFFRKFFLPVPLAGVSVPRVSPVPKSPRPLCVERGFARRSVALGPSGSDQKGEASGRRCAPAWLPLRARDGGRHTGCGAGPHGRRMAADLRVARDGTASAGGSQGR